MPERNPKLETFLKTLLPPRGEDEVDIGPMMRAIKAFHSAAADGSTDPESLARQRSSQNLFARLVTPTRGVRAEGLLLNNSLSAEWVGLEVGHDRHHVILYCHGGGYTCGTLEYARILASKLALHTGFDVLSFAYRLAPESSCPAQLEDSLTAWNYLMYQGYGARDVIVAGDSAGGNLALELTLKLKAQTRQLPRALVLMSPWTDMTMRGESYTECKELDPMLTEGYIQAVRTAYAGAQADFADPVLSPLFADLSGLPPALIQVGTHEILRSDSTELAQALRRQGGYAELEVYEDCWHVFQQMPVRRAADAMEAVSRFVQKML
ncbi:MAG: alpha/beta hydrolase [Faecalibacterium sp.]